MNSAYQFGNDPSVHTIGGSWYLGSDYEGGGVGIAIKGFFAALHEMQALAGTQSLRVFQGDQIGLHELIEVKGSPLLKLMVERLGVDLTSKYSEIYGNQPDGKKVAFFSPLAPLVSQAAIAQEPDPVAVMILEESGHAVSKLVRLGLSIGNARDAAVALIGGVITKEGPARISFISDMDGYDLSLMDFPKTRDLLIASIAAE